MGAWPVVAHCMNTAYAKVARPEQALAELSGTIALYCAMDMTFWLPHAKEALAVWNNSPSGSGVGLGPEHEGDERGV